MTESGTLKIFGDSRSGNCYKLQLLCAEMEIEYEWQEVDILAGETRTPDFLAMNQNGRIPLLELPDGRYLAESNAILCYLADDSRFFPGDAFDRADVLRWMFFEQYSHEPNIATSRFIIQYLGNPADKQDALQSKRAAGYEALRVMEEQLAKTDFLCGAMFSIADIALFAYTHVAEEGGFQLENYSSILGWINRIQSRPRHLKMAIK